MYAKAPCYYYTTEWDLCTVRGPIVCWCSFGCTVSSIEQDNCCFSQNRTYDKSINTNQRQQFSKQQQR